ncbi:MAG TPA: diguanylate cyclase [Acidimicrobiales bacterium]|nr:diguanylate cyclase [Acidimicrobiales bacterium]
MDRPDLPPLLGAITAASTTGRDAVVARLTAALAAAAPGAGASLELPGAAPVEVVAGLTADALTVPLTPGTGDGGLLRVTPPAPLGDADLAALAAVAAVAGHAIGAARTVEALRAELDEARHGELHDPLTGLPNRLLLVDRIEQTLARVRRSGHTAALVFCDLDDFKHVNDTYGHRVGDAVLMAFAGRLRSLLRPGDTAARLGGDEFVVLCDDLDDPADGEAIAVRLGRALDDPFSLAAGAIHVGASLGVVAADPARHTPEGLLEDADAAMYRAKRRGGRRVEMIDLREASEAAARGALAGELRAALAADRIEVAYDPIVESVDGRTTGVEVVPVWARSGAPLAGAALRAVAEDAGLAAELWRALLRRACSDRAAWCRAGCRPGLAIDVGAAELLSPGFPAAVAEVLDVSGTEPGALTVELPEAVLRDHGARAVDVLGRLQQLGVVLALDCYGTPSSSLGTLREVSFDEVKLDARVVGGLADPATHATAFATVELAHLLGMVVVAEGVDTDDTHEAVTVLGCDRSQGERFSGRLAAADVPARVGAWREGVPRRVARGA